VPCFGWYRKQGSAHGKLIPQRVQTGQKPPVRLYWSKTSQTSHKLIRVDQLFFWRLSGSVAQMVGCGVELTQKGGEHRKRYVPYDLESCRRCRNYSCICAPTCSNSEYVYRLCVCEAPVEALIVLVSQQVSRQCNRTINWYLVPLRIYAPSVFYKAEIIAACSF